MRCKYCSEEIDSAFRFCPWCGRQIIATAATENAPTRRHKRPVNDDFKLAREIYLTWYKDLFLPKYSNLAECGYHEIGFSKAQTYNYRAVGEKFIDNDYQLRFMDNGNWTIKQLSLMSKLSLDKVNQLIQDNIIDASMTCVQLEEILQNL